MSVAAVIMRMTGMAVVVIVAMVVTMIGAVAVGMPNHDPILRAQGRRAQPSHTLIRQFDTVPAGMD
jgi:hypothetical protein